MASNRKPKLFKKKTFDCDWVVKNWTNVVQNDELVENTKTEVNCRAAKLLYAKFVIGLKLYRNEQTGTVTVGFYWKLLCRHYCLENARANLVVGIMNKGTEDLVYQSLTNAENPTTAELGTGFWGFGSVCQVANWINNDGSVVFKLRLTLKYLPLEDCESITADFRKACTDDLSENLATLLENSSCSDLKIVTKENTEHFAHKTILCARCPIFASMFRSNFLESSTGILKVDDISAKTMKILLTYWYTGNLLPSWKDDDIVAEFTYAAGKYQMTQVLQMLDDSLGKTFTASNENVELLKIVERLSLKNAEGRMLKRVVNKIRQDMDGAELLEVFGLSTEQIKEDSFGVSQVLKFYDDSLSKNASQSACPQDVKMVALAYKLGMKNVEEKLLKLIVGTVSKMSSAGELFALFNLKNENSDESSEASNLLVGSNPIRGVKRGSDEMS